MTFCFFFFYHFINFFRGGRMGPDETFFLFFFSHFINSFVKIN